MRRAKHLERIFKRFNAPNAHVCRTQSPSVAGNGSQWIPSPRVLPTPSSLSTRHHSPVSLGPNSRIFVPRDLIRNASSTSQNEPRRTALYDLHIEHEAKMVPFGGYSMPLQYADLSHVESHTWTRERCSLFDVSHMVQHSISGHGAEAFLMKVTPSSLNTLPPNHSTLSCLLEEENGGIVDDTVITRLGSESFYFVTNAACRDDDLAFLTRELQNFKSHADTQKSISWNVLDQHSLLALQGPYSASVLQPLINTESSSDSETDLSTLHFGQCRRLFLTLPNGSPTPAPVLVSRTGYTGEDGFEISIQAPKDDPDLGTTVANLLLSSSDVRLAGLAARDSLRLEAGMCLYGHDIGLDTTPPTAGLGWVVGKDRRTLPSDDSSSFNGAPMILPQLSSPAKNLSRRRVGLTIEPGAPAREGAEIIDLKTEEVIGKVTSGLPSPSLNGQNIAMGYVKQGSHKRGTELGVRVRKKVRRAEVVRMPFVESRFYRGEVEKKNSNAMPA